MDRAPFSKSFELNAKKYIGFLPLGNQADEVQVQQKLR